MIRHWRKIRGSFVFRHNALQIRNTAFAIRELLVAQVFPVQVKEIEGEENRISAPEQQIIESRPALGIQAYDFTVEDCCSCIRLPCDGRSFPHRTRTDCFRHANGFAAYSVSNNGVLVYEPAGSYFAKPATVAQPCGQASGCCR
jgi:hypothetical protein